MKKWIVGMLLAVFASGCATTSSQLRGGIDGDDLVRIAQKQIGVKYRYGGNSPSEGFDCSGLVHYCFHKLGVEVPRSTTSLFSEGHKVKKGHLLPGDLVFFRFDGGSVSHVGIYVKGDRMVHAPSTGSKVRIDSIAMKYWLDRFAGARRLD